MNEDVRSVPKDVHLGEVLRIMRDEGLSKVPVTDDGAGVAGIVTDGAIADKLGALRNKRVHTNTLHASSVMVREFRTARPGDPWAHLIDLLHGDPIQGPPPVGLLPIVDEEAGLVGVVTRADFLAFIRERAPVSRLAVTDLVTVRPTDRLVHARRVMLDHGIERLPVLDDDGRICGIIAEMDLALALATMKRRVEQRHQARHLERLLVRDAMVRQVVTARPDTEIRTAAGTMLHENVGCLPLVTDGGHPAGIVTRSDLMHVLEIEAHVVENDPLSAEA